MAEKLVEQNKLVGEKTKDQFDWWKSNLCLYFEGKKKKKTNKQKQNHTHTQRYSLVVDFKVALEIV